MKELLKKGDKVKIRSLDWFNTFKINDSMFSLSSVGQFVENTMSKYCGMEATITNIGGDSTDPNTGFLLDIDDEKWGWQEFMIEPSSIIKNRLREFCNSCENNNMCCKFCLFDENNLKSPLKVGDKVVIKTLEWFKTNEICVTNGDLYFGEEATITNVINLGSNMYTYNLDIDNNLNLWPDYMFNTYTRFLNLRKNFCKNYCIVKDCKKCTLNKKERK